MAISDGKNLIVKVNGEIPEGQISGGIDKNGNIFYTCLMNFDDYEEFQDKEVNISLVKGFYNADKMEWEWSETIKEQKLKMTSRLLAKNNAPLLAHYATKDSDSIGLENMMTFDNSHKQELRVIKNELKDIKRLIAKQKGILI